MHYKYHLTVIHGKSEYSYKGPVISLMRSSNEVTINVIITINIITITINITITITPNEVTILLILIVAVASLLGILELCHQPLNHHDMGS